MKDKLLFLGVDSITRFAIAYAQSIGVYTIVTDYNPPEKRPEKRMADEFWMINIFDLDALEQKCREEHVTGIFSGSNEMCLEPTRELARRLGLPFHASQEGWACARDKALFKEYCQKAGVDVPRLYEVSKPITSEMLDAMSFPVIVKPVDACAARGITVCNSREEVEAAYDYALQFSESGRVIVEDFVGGEELVSFFYIDNGKAYLTHVNLDVFALQGGNPTVCGGMVLKHKGSTQFIHEELGEKFQKLFSSMNCKHGNIFVQGKMYNGKYYVFEMGYRLDGLCDFTVTKPLFGFSAMESMVHLALGRKYPYNGETYLTNNGTSVGLMFLIWANPGKICKIVSEQVRNMEGVSFVAEHNQVGDEIFPTRNMLQIPYLLAMVADSPAEMIEKIKKINRDLLMLDENGNNMLVPYLRFDDLHEALSQV